MSLAERILAIIGKGESVTPTEIIARLGRVKGATFATIVTRTEPKMRKTGNPYFGKVAKIARSNVMLNFQYEDGVLRRLEKEGKSSEDFKRGESWHEPVIDEKGRLTPFCRHKRDGTMYLRSALMKSLGAKYLDNETGEKIDKSALEPFLQESNYANQGLDSPLVFLTHKLDSIKAITYNGETLVL